MSALEEALETAFQQIGWLLVLGTAPSFWPYRPRPMCTGPGSCASRTRKLLELTRYDQLTGILNRNSVSEILDEFFTGPNARANGLGVLFVDVDYFKQVNDQYGHACGDLLLKHIAGISARTAPAGPPTLSAGSAATNLLCCAPDIAREEFRKLYGRVMEGAKTPCSHEDKSYTPSLSVGAYLTEDGDTEKTALHRADLAVYAAKRRGRGQVVEYSGDLEGLFKQDTARQTA